MVVGWKEDYSFFLWKVLWHFMFYLHNYWINFMCNCLRYTKYYFDVFMYCNTIADVAICITLHNFYCLYSLYYVLDLYSLLPTCYVCTFYLFLLCIKLNFPFFKNLNSISLAIPSPHHLETTILFSVFYRFNVFRFHINSDIT